MKCVCDYDAKDEDDLEQHILAMMHVDGPTHGEK